MTKCKKIFLLSGDILVLICILFYLFIAVSRGFDLSLVTTIFISVVISILIYYCQSRNYIVKYISIALTLNIIILFLFFAFDNIIGLPYRIFTILIVSFIAASRVVDILGNKERKQSGYIRKLIFGFLIMLIILDLIGVKFNLLSNVSLSRNYCLSGNNILLDCMKNKTVLEGIYKSYFLNNYLIGKTDENYILYKHESQKTMEYFIFDVSKGYLYKSSQKRLFEDELKKKNIPAPKELDSLDGTGRIIQNIRYCFTTRWLQV